MTHTWKAIIDTSPAGSIQVDRKRRALLAQLGSPINTDTFTTSQARTLVESLRDIVETLQEADPATRPISTGR